MMNFLRYILESAVCLAFFCGVYWLFLKKETYFSLNRIYLVSSLVLSFIIPALRVPSPFFTIRAAEEHFSLLSTPAVLHRSFGVKEILLSIYVAGALLFLARLAFHLAKLYRVVRQTGVRHAYSMKIVSVDKEFSPFSFLNVVFINDTKITEGNLQRILAHERVHIRQHHSLDILLMELVIVLQWFNPFVWPYKKSLQETHEYLADEGVIAQGFSVTMYQLLVFEQHVGTKLFEFANNFKQSQIKRRLTMMSKIKSRNAARLKLFLVLPLASFLVLAFADPRPVNRAGGPTGLAPQEKADLGRDVQKEKIHQAKADLEMLKDKEAKLREKLDSAPTPEAKQEVEKQLEIVQHKLQELQTFLANAGSAPDPSEPNLKAEYKMLEEKEVAIREKLKATTDAAVKAELEATLAKVLDKEAEIKAMGMGGAPEKLELEKLKQEYMLLEQKKQDVRAQLEKTEDPQKKAELEDILKKIAQKQEMIKAKAGAVKAKVEAEKTAREEKKQ